MENGSKILVVEDDPVVNAALDMILSELGHELCGKADNAMDAIVAFTLHHPDMVICDINLNGPVNGVELIKRINQLRKVPVLFLTAHNSQEVFNKAKAVAPLAFIPKPLDRGSLERAIALAAEHARESTGFSVDPLPVEECLYTRVGNKLRKICIQDIEHVEVDGKYCTLSVAQRNINCKISLKELMEKLPRQKFVQISRNTVINMDMIEDIDMAQMQVKLPSSSHSISRNFRDNFLQRIHLI